MRWPVSYIRRLTIAGALFAATATAIYLVRTEPPTLIGCSPTDDLRSYPFHTWVSLTFKELHPAGNLFTGAVAIEMNPRSERMKPEDITKWAADFQQVVLRFDRFESNSLVYQGGGDTPIGLAFPPAWGSLQGKGTFSWAGIPQPGPFFYPFDRYVLKVHPSLLQLSSSGYYPVYPIDTLVTDFGNSNFIPQLRNLHTKSPNDLYEDHSATPGSPAHAGDHCGRVAGRVAHLPYLVRQSGCVCGTDRHSLFGCVFDSEFPAFRRSCFSRPDRLLRPRRLSFGCAYRPHKVGVPRQENQGMPSLQVHHSLESKHLSAVCPPARPTANCCCVAIVPVFPDQEEIALFDLLTKARELNAYELKTWLMAES